MPAPEASRPTPPAAESPLSDRRDPSEVSVSIDFFRSLRSSSRSGRPYGKSVVRGTAGGAAAPQH